MSELKDWECPCDIAPESRAVCSAGTCYWCVVDRLAACYRDGELRLDAALDRVIAEVEAQTHESHGFSPWVITLQTLRALREQSPSSPTAQKGQDNER